MGLDKLNITSTSSRITLIELLDLESQTKLVNSSCCSITRLNSPKINRSIKGIIRWLSYPGSNNANIAGSTLIQSINGSCSAFLLASLLLRRVLM